MTLNGGQLRTFDDFGEHFIIRNSGFIGSSLQFILFWQSIHRRDDVGLGHKGIFAQQGGVCAN